MNKKILLLPIMTLMLASCGETSSSTTSSNSSTLTSQETSSISQSSSEVSSESTSEETSQEVEQIITKDEALVKIDEIERYMYEGNLPKQWSLFSEEYDLERKGDNVYKSNQLHNQIAFDFEAGRYFEEHVGENTNRVWSWWDKGWSYTAQQNNNVKEYAKGQFSRTAFNEDFSDMSNETLRGFNIQQTTALKNNLGLTIQDIQKDMEAQGATGIIIDEFSFKLTSTGEGSLCSEMTLITRKEVNTPGTVPYTMLGKSYSKVKWIDNVLMDFEMEDSVTQTTHFEEMDVPITNASISYGNFTLDADIILPDIETFTLVNRS